MSAVWSIRSQVILRNILKETRLPIIIRKLSIVSNTLTVKKLYRNSNEFNNSLTRCRYYSTSSEGLSYYHAACEQPLVGFTLANLVDQTNLKYGDRTAVVDCAQGIRKTYSEYVKDIDKLAASFIALGFKRGDRIAIWSPNCYQWLLVEYAAARIGLILTCINPLNKAKELEHCLKLSGTKALVVAENMRDDKLYDIVKEVLPNLDNCKPGQLKQDGFPLLDTVIMISEKNYPGTCRFKDIFEAGGSVDFATLRTVINQIQSHDPACIMFTSGTTGAPKGATLSHHNIVNMGSLYARRYNMDKELNKFCTCMPLFHVMGMMASSLYPFFYGHQVVFPSPWYSVKKLMEAIHNEKCTAVIGTPTMYVDIINHPDFKKYDFSNLSLGGIGGAPASPEMLKDIRAKLSLDTVGVGYGCTECTLLVTGTRRDTPHDLVETTVGTVAEHLEVKVVDTNGNLVPFGTPGELLVRGYCTMLGYWNDEKKTKESFTPDGWYKTGDILTLDEKGYGRIKGRIKEMIIRGGENVYPKEVEDFLTTHPKIIEAHVFGIPHQRLGEEICAWILLKQGEMLTQEELVQFCEGKISSYKIPVNIKFVDEFPRLGSGKVSKLQMKEQTVQAISN